MEERDLTIPAQRVVRLLLLLTMRRDCWRGGSRLGRVYSLLVLPVSRLVSPSNNTASDTSTIVRRNGDVKSWLVVGLVRRRD